MARITMGDRLLLFFREYNLRETENGSKLRFQTEHSISKEKESDAIWTKDGTQNTIRDGENTISISSLKYEEDDDILSVLDKLEKMFEDNKLVEIWQVNLDSATTPEGTYSAHYFQGYFTSLEITAADSAVEVSLEYAINGRGAKGTDLLTPEQIGAINAEQYEYQSIKALGGE